MGCWNGTCGVSQLPIKWGDEIVLFILFNRHPLGNIVSGGYCYSDTIFHPISAPIFGKYNDYGSIEDAEQNDVVLNHFNSQIKDGVFVLTDVEECKEHNRYNEETGFPSLDDLIDVIERGYLEDIGFMMVHKQLYINMIEEMKSRKFYDKDYGLEQMMDRKINEYFKELKSEDEFKRMIYFLSSRNDFTRYFIEHKMKYLVDAMDENAYIIQLMKDLYVFNTALCYSRIAWMVQTGAGSQSQESKIHAIIGQFMVDYEKKCKKEYEENNEYDEQDFEDCTRETMFDWVD